MGDKIALQTNRRTNKKRTPRTTIIARQDSFRILGIIIRNSKYDEKGGALIPGESNELQLSELDML